MARPKLPRIEVFAPAKLNLSLHITAQRGDGYHLLDSLVVFADIGDRLSIDLAAPRGLQITGPFRDALPPSPDNLALRAAELALPDNRGAIVLEKNLPVAAGIGGGSSDAAAILAGAEAWSGTRQSLDDILALGADLPVCLAARPARMRGIGEQIEPCATWAAFLPVVLVNPGGPLSTQDVFAALTQKTNPPMPDPLPMLATFRQAVEFLRVTRNDLEPPARAIAPVIGSVLDALEATSGCALARMSGSGPTCFGLYATEAEAGMAARRIALAEPGWWVQSGLALGPREADPFQILIEGA